MSKKKIQEKIPTVQEAIKRSQAVRNPLEGRREVAVHHPSICMKKNRQAFDPKPFTQNLSHPSLWVHGACAGGMSSRGGPQYDDGLEYEFMLPLESIPKHGVFIHVHRSLSVVELQSSKVFQRFLMTSPSVAFLDITLIAGV